MTEQDLHLGVRTLIEEALREIEAIKEALEASREKHGTGGHDGVVTRH